MQCGSAEIGALCKERPDWEDVELGPYHVYLIAIRHLQKLSQSVSDKGMELDCALERVDQHDTNSSPPGLVLCSLLFNLESADAACREGVPVYD